MVKKKKIGILIVSLFYIISLAGCNKEEQNSESEKNILTEYYKGEELNCPKKLQYVTEIVQIRENHYLLVGGEEDGDGFLWETTNGGDQWEKKIDRADELKADVLIEAAVLDEKHIFCAFTDKDLSGGTRYYLVSEEGEFQETTLEGMGPDTDALTDIEYVGSLIYGRTVDGNVGAFDPYTGKKMGTYAMTSLFVNMYCVMDDSIILIGPEGAESYSVKTGERIEDNFFLEKELYKLASKNENYYAFVRCWNNKIYYLTLDGLYELDRDHKQVRIVINGQGQPFGSINSYLCGFSQLGDEDLAISIIDREKKSSTWRYVYTPEGVDRSVPATEINIYSLTKNPVLETMINVYNSAQKEAYIYYEYGMNGQDVVTESDAINQLNTELAAGKGPDIILLDGLPEQSYIEEGLLMDVSELLSKEHLKNITSAYEKNDKIYGIPGYFKLLGIMGEETVVESTGDFDKLTDGLKRLYEKEQDSLVLDRWFQGNYIDTLYHAYFAEVVEQNQLDVEKLEKFYENLKTLNDIAEFDWNVVIEDEEDKIKCNYSNLNIVSSDWTLQMIGSNELEVSIGGITSVQDLIRMSSYSTDKKGVSWSYFCNGDETIFIPSQAYGINNNSRKKDEAKKFLEYMISEEAYFVINDLNTGFPINIKALSRWVEETETWKDEYITKSGKTVILQNFSMDKTEKTRFIDMVKKLKQVSKVDKGLQSIIMEQAEKYVNSEGTLEECVKAAVEKGNLYLME